MAVRKVQKWCSTQLPGLCPFLESAFIGLASLPTLLISTPLQEEGADAPRRTIVQSILPPLFTIARVTPYLTPIRIKSLAC
jgi:hypothetical protein